MGIDCLDFACRMEKRLQIPVRPQHLFLGHHTTVADVVELLWQRLHGLEFEEDVELIRLYHELDKRVVSIGPRGFWGWVTGSRCENRRLEDIIPPHQRTLFWESLRRDFYCPLPPLRSDPGEADPRFPEEIYNQRSLLQFLRAHLFQQIKWIPVAPSQGSAVISDARSISHREAPRTREELFAIIRQELSDTLVLALDEVVPDAELIDDLGME